MKNRLIQLFLILVILFSAWLMVDLLSFNPSDPSWSQAVWPQPIHNLGGIFGAWIADMLFFIFGMVAYAIPVILITIYWFVWKDWKNDNKIDYFAVSLRLIGALSLILTFCSLASINANDIWYFSSGGVIGSLLSSVLEPMLHKITSIVLLCNSVPSLTLFTGWSWVSIVEKTGSASLSILRFFRNGKSQDNIQIDEDRYEKR